jgi:hypothetical protein
MRHPQSPQSLSDQAARLMLNAPISLDRKSVPAPPTTSQQKDLLDNI